MGLHAVVLGFIVGYIPMHARPAGDTKHSEENGDESQ
jgi:hypothetical protein